MMIEKERVLGAFALLADITEEEARKNEPLVQLAIDEVASLVTDEDLSAQQRDLLHHAAAAVAYEKYVSVLSTRDAVTVTVGDVRIDQADLSAARKLREEALETVLRFCRSRQFAFEVIV